MKVALRLAAAVLLGLNGCTATSPTQTTDLGTSQSNLEEVPGDAVTKDTELPELEQLVTSSEYLIGSWKSDCLIPDNDSDYAEQHYFEFYANRTALYKAETFYKKSCVGSDYTLVINYTYTIPTSGQINLTDLVTGQTMYDIYQVETSQLMFGHGFRNTLPYPPQSGLSEADRFPTLNQYIIYTKQS